MAGLHNTAKIHHFTFAVISSLSLLSVWFIAQLKLILTVLLGKMDFKSHIFCCNPLGKSVHTRWRKNLRKVQPWMVQKCPNVGLTLDRKICSLCRKSISEMPGPSCITETDAEADQPELLSDDNSEVEVQSEMWTDRDTSLNSLNDKLLSLGESPVKKKKNYVLDSTERRNLRRLVML